MPEYEKKNGDFTISKNDRKRPDKKDPDAQIRVYWEGEYKYIGIWNREGKDGKFGTGSLANFLSEIGQAAGHTTQQPIKSQSAPQAQADEDLPF
jgi:hypothetical protein